MPYESPAVDSVGSAPGGGDDKERACCGSDGHRAGPAGARVTAEGSERGHVGQGHRGVN